MYISALIKKSRGCVINKTGQYILLVVCLFLLGTEVIANPAEKLDSLQSELALTQDPETKANLLMFIGRIHRRENLDSGLYYLNLAREICEENNFQRSQFDLMHEIGIAFDMHGLPDSAIYYFKTELTEAEKNHDTIRQSKASNSLGVVYYREGNYDNSMLYYTKALELGEALNDTGLIVKFNDNIGHIFYYQGNFDKALQHYGVAKSIAEASGDSGMLSGANQNMGYVHMARENYLEAKKCFEFALRIEKGYENPYGMANCYQNLAICWNHLDNRSKSIEYYKMSMDLFERMDNKEGIAQTLVNMGELENRFKNYRKAIEYFSSGLEISREIKSGEGQKYSYIGLSKSYELLGNMEKALEMFKLYSELKDSIYSENTSRQINELETKYETHKKEKAIELLNKENALKSAEIARDELKIAKNNAELAKQKQFIYGLIFLVILIGIVLVLIFVGWQQRKKTNQLLEEKNNQILEANEELHQTNEEISAQRDFIEDQRNQLAVAHQGIQDSIIYARRLQATILPSEQMVKQLLPDSFIYYQPKDVLSGDYYWVHEAKEGVLFAAVDCTGHGVPGAMMSLMGNNGLTKAVIELGIEQPAEILTFLDEYVKQRVQRNQEDVKDGMDMAVCLLKRNGEIEYSGANNPLYFVQNGEIQQIKATKQPVGGAEKPFVTHTVQLEKGEMVFVFSDGLADQFGGPKGRKFTYKRLRELFLDISQEKDNHRQVQQVDKAFFDWKGMEEQVDDICVIGVRV